jgi:hypothetical protein
LTRQFFFLRKKTDPQVNVAAAVVPGPRVTTAKPCDLRVSAPCDAVGLAEQKMPGLLRLQIIVAAFVTLAY